MNNELENRKTLMGSSTNIAMRNWQLPVIIIKALCPSEQRTFVMAADCSEPSKRGLDAIACLLKPSDCLILLHIDDTSNLQVPVIGATSGKRRPSFSGLSVSSSNLNNSNTNTMNSLIGGDSKIVEEFYKADLDRLDFSNKNKFQHEPKCVTIMREAGTGTSLVDMIIETVNNQIKPDFLVVVPRTRKHLTGVTEELIYRSNASVILCNSL